MIYFILWALYITFIQSLIWGIAAFVFLYLPICALIAYNYAKQSH